MMSEGLGSNFKPFPSPASIPGQSESSCSAGSIGSYPSGAESTMFTGVPATSLEDNAVVPKTCSTNDMDHTVTVDHTGYVMMPHLSRSGSDQSLDSGTAMEDLICKCPCGRMDFSHILNPPPDCLANRHSDSRSFPELDMKSSNKIAQDQLKMKLKRQTQIIKQEFRTFGLAVRRYAKSIPDIENILKECLSLDGKVVEALDFETLYPKFREGADLINFDILSRCLTNLKSSDDTGEENELRRLAEEAAKKYEASFQEFAQQRVVLVPTILQDANGRSNSLYKELKIKVEEDFRSFLVERSLDFKEILKRILKLAPDVYLRVTSVREGCVEICFEMIDLHADTHISLNDAQKQELLANKITLLEYDGQVSYCCCELCSDESSRDTIKKVYNTVCLADYQKDEVDDVDGSSEHTLGCPCLSPQASIENVCSIEECPSCGIRLRRCSLEYHLLQCERSDSSCPSSSDESDTEELPCAKKADINSVSCSDQINMADSDDTQFLLGSPVDIESTDRTIGGNVLSIDDLYEALDAVIDAADKWYSIGLALNVREPTLRQIQSRSSGCTTCLRETLSHWLRNSQSTTWQDVIQALCSRSVDQRKIAKDIAQSRGLILPVAAISKPLTLSAPEDVSQLTSIQRLPSDYHYLSFAGDVLSEKHRASSTAVSMTSLRNPIHAGPSDFPHDLQWNTRPDISALQKMSSPIDAAVHSDTAYFRPYRSRKIYSYNLTSGWSKSAKCLVRDASLVVLPVAYKGADHFHLHTIGGIKRKIHQQDEDEEKYTDVIYQLTDREWTCSTYPKLRTKRSQMTVVFSNGCLIIAGGNSAHGIIQTVDVLIVTSQDKVWREVSSLPYSVFRASGCVCNGMLYILGGYVSPFDPVRSACVATVSQLVESNSNDQNIFNTIKDLELYDSACVSFRNHILAIGGWKKLGAALTDQPKGTKLVHVYDTSRNIWKELKGQLSEPRCFAFAAAFEDRQQIMIVGGYDRPSGACTYSVEFAIIP